MNETEIQEIINLNMKKTRISAKEELDKRVHTGELVYVDDYTREDGTHVSGYYRSYPRS